MAILLLVSTFIFSATGAEQTLFNVSKDLNWAQARQFCEENNLKLYKLAENDLGNLTAKYPQIKGSKIWSDGRCSWKNMTGHEISLSSKSKLDGSGKNNCLAWRCLGSLRCKIIDRPCSEKQPFLCSGKRQCGSKKKPCYTIGKYQWDSSACDQNPSSSFISVSNVAALPTGDYWKGLGYYSCKTVNGDAVDIIPRDNDFQNGDCYSFDVSRDAKEGTRNATSCGKPLTKYILCSSDKQASTRSTSTKPATTTTSSSKPNSTTTANAQFTVKSATVKSTPFTTSTSAPSTTRPSTTIRVASTTRSITTTGTPFTKNPTKENSSKTKTSSKISSAVVAMSSVTAKILNDKETKTTAKLYIFSHSKPDGLSFSDKNDETDINDKAIPENNCTKNSGAYAGIGVAVVCLCIISAAVIGFLLRRKKMVTRTSTPYAAAMNATYSPPIQARNEAAYENTNEKMNDKMKTTSFVDSLTISHTFVNESEYTVVDKTQAAKSNVITTSGDIYINQRDSMHLYDDPASVEEPDTIYHVLDPDDPTVEKTVENDFYVPWKSD